MIGDRGRYLRILRISSLNLVPAFVSAVGESCELPYNLNMPTKTATLQEFVIEGGTPLRGEVVPSGNKNAALPLLAACLLAEEPVTLRNVPLIRAVLDMRRLIESLGASVEELDANTWRVHAGDLQPSKLDPDLC